MNNQPAIFGVRCDAITKKGKRCTRKNRSEMPCIAVYDARCNSYRADEFKPVRLCYCHSNIEWKLRQQGKRLKLHHVGWLGPVNQYSYGNIVINKQTVNWKTVKRLIVPKFWQNDTQKII